jgi:hypothetical protein
VLPLEKLVGEFSHIEIIAVLRIMWDTQILRVRSVDFFLLYLAVYTDHKVLKCKYFTVQYPELLIYLRNFVVTFNLSK